MQKTNARANGNIDLRALRFLMAVLEHRSVTKAGDAMGMSQPAASRLLAQLRHAAGDDPLIVRASGGGNVLTVRAMELLPCLAEAIAATDRVFAPVTFDLATSTRSFRVATTDYGAAVVIAPLMQTVRAEAPSLSLELCAWSAATLPELEKGQADFALYTDEALPPGFQYERLFDESFACFLRHDHPVLEHRNAAGHVAASRLAALPRAVLLYPDGAGTGVDDPLAAHGRPLGPGDVRLPYFLSAPLIVRGSDAVLCIPRRMAELVAEPAGLAVIDFPEAGHFTYCMIRHERAAKDPGLDWLQKRLVATVAPPDRDEAVRNHGKRKGWML